MVNVLGLLVTHKWADIDQLECIRIGETQEVIEELLSYEGVNECAVLQTCHRVEIYIVPDSLKEGREILLDYIEKKTEIDIDRYVRFYAGKKLLHHMLRLASGLESMVIGEDQILGQMSETYQEARETGSAQEKLSMAFEKSINVGKKVRNQTAINEGCVSVGSAAVDLAEEIHGELTGKEVLIIGAGEMATLVAKSLNERDLGGVTVANRTYERAERLSRKVGGRPVEYERYTDYLPEVDIIITATGAPHPIIEKDDIDGVNGNNLMIIDISNPRDVDNEVGDLANVNLFDIDDLTIVTEKNREKRLGEAEKAEGICKRELDLLIRRYEEKKIDDLIAVLHERADEIRRQEMEKALHKLSLENGEEEVIEDLTRSIKNKLLSSPTRALKKAAVDRDQQLIETASEIFQIENEEKK
ncbi:glutamyl-tRNA reductase [Methanonatronarchaeum sp. AMET6-2]|uniref:glutamyl-tRNA reductase n=1 Tax=Methanonatronarchaeum sp. AMET6-2 TaxID=2933293 RepID=UPI00121F07C7|nr:glutamyl-tRNA reductase [Methanonatronarchaeum sp. AMET6-2]RZN60630.1 MAG: glutamyl-tRNA reductase [Methanonatronarchaeia archaeon]UOY09667.1 glutamyl-tRNA reductase [Methanonatronarchaeum sp. AMET6-2]